jgi:hypothetical protein
MARHRTTPFIGEAYRARQTQERWLENYSFLTASVEIKKANLYAVFRGAILCRFSNAAGRKGAVEHLFRVVANRTLHGPQTGLWDVSSGKFGYWTQTDPDYL